MAAQIELRNGLQKMRIEAKLDVLPAKLLSHFFAHEIVQQRLIGQFTQFSDPSLSDCLHHPRAH